MVYAFLIYMMFLKRTHRADREFCFKQMNVKSTDALADESMCNTCGHLRGPADKQVTEAHRLPQI
jgi:hypothetical protein